MIRLLLPLVVAVVFLSCGARPKNQAHDSDVSSMGLASDLNGGAIGVLLGKPLIAGASISAGVNTESPGLRAALRYTARENVLEVALPGKPALIVAPRVSSDLLAGRSLLIGLDLLFWDSALNFPELSAQALDALLGRAEAAGVPVILGDVPLLKPGLQPSRDAINGKIKSLCTKTRHCSVLGLDAMHQRLIADGYLEIGGKRLTREEILPDGLHLSAAAAEYIAGMIEDQLLSDDTP